MPIPETLSARRAELERMIDQDEQDAMTFDLRAEEARQAMRITRAELSGIDRAIAAYEAAEVPQTSAPEKRERRDLRKLVLEYIERGTNDERPANTHNIVSHFGLKPSQALIILSTLRDHGKITGSDSLGWRLADPETLQQAAE